MRVYYFASTQHVPSARSDPGICQQPSNTLRYEETPRALLLALQAWVTTGAEPLQPTQ